MSKRKRSALMSKIKRKGTKPELVLIKLIQKNHVRGYSVQPKMLGNPDLVFKKQKIAIFCDGEFWHGYHFNEWKKNIPDFWNKKITSNIKRDNKVRRKLRKLGWVVLRFWGRKIVKRPEGIISKIKKVISERND